MNHFIKARILVLAAVALFLAGPVSAQEHRSAIGLTVGGSAHGDLTPGLATETRFESGWLAGLQYEYWFGTGRTGVRFNTLFTQRLLDSPVWHDYNVFVADVDLLVRLTEPDYRRTISPFFALGAGATHYGAVAGSAPLGDGVYGENVVRAHLLTSLGLDVAASPTTGVRVEVGDKIVLPSIGYSPTFSGFPNVHNLVATVALQLRLGSLDGWASGPSRAAPVEPAAPPAPEPVPEAEAAEPEPEPAVDPEREAALAELQSRVTTLNRELARLELWIGELEDRLARAPAVETRTLFTVQVGSFLEPARANRLVERVRDYGLPVWRWDATARGTTFSRVRAGAVATESEAERLAVLLQQEYGLPVWVDRIESAEDVPAGAVSGTRSFLDQTGG